MIVKQFGFPTLSFGLPDQFIEHGTYTVLMEKAGLSATLIAKEIYENHWSLSQPIETTSS